MKERLLHILFSKQIIQEITDFKSLRIINDLQKNNRLNKILLNQKINELRNKKDEIHWFGIHKQFKKLLLSKTIEQLDQVYRDEKRWSNK